MNPPDKTAQFLSLIQANKGIIYKVANAYCENDENRKDLIQEIIIQLWLSLDRFDPQYKVSTWMYRVALNVCISSYRKERRRSEINQPFSEGMLYLEEEIHESDSQEDLLQKFIKELKEIDRAVIILYLEGNTQRDMADMLGLTVTNIATKISTIKKHLKAQFARTEKD